MFRMKLQFIRRLAAAAGLLASSFSNLSFGAETATKVDSKRTEPWAWVDATNLCVEGKGWQDTKTFCERLPRKAEGKVREPVWNLAQFPAGLCVRFVTDATTIRARWKLTSDWLHLPNMSPTGASGLDLYVRAPADSWHWIGIGHPTAASNEVNLVEKLIPGTREYLLYLPLHNGLESMELGVAATNTLVPAKPRAGEKRRPILFYGTSITHGLGVSRPGMTHVAILGRRFDWPVLNLGFSGNGKMEPEMAVLLAELDPAIYVIDCLPNMGADEIQARVEPFVRILRASHPQTPIVLVEDRTMADAFLVAGRMEYYHEKDRAELRAAYDRLRKAGISQLYYITGEELLGSDGEATVDGSHPSDLGAMRQAEAFAEVIGPLLPRPR